MIASNRNNSNVRQQDNGLWAIISTFIQWTTTQQLEWDQFPKIVTTWINLIDIM